LVGGRLGRVVLASRLARGWVSIRGA